MLLVLVNGLVSDGLCHTQRTNHQRAMAGLPRAAPTHGHDQARATAAAVAVDRGGHWSARGTCRRLAALEKLRLN